MAIVPEIYSLSDRSGSNDIWFANRERDVASGYRNLLISPLDANVRKQCQKYQPYSLSSSCQQSCSCIARWELERSCLCLNTLQCKQQPAEATRLAQLTESFLHENYSQTSQTSRSLRSAFLCPVSTRHQRESAVCPPLLLHPNC